MILINGFVKKRRNKFFDCDITACFTLEDRLPDGFDMERFAATSLIDGMIQAKVLADGVTFCYSIFIWADM